MSDHALHLKRRQINLVYWENEGARRHVSNELFHSFSNE